MCGDQLDLHLYIDVDDPGSRVEFNELYRRVEIILGNDDSIRGRSLNLWFGNPKLVIDLGRQMIDAGEELRAEQTRRYPGTGDG